MRKIDFLKTVLSVAFAALLSVGIQAQVPDANYGRYDSDRLNPDTIDYVTLKTGGTEMGYYALPDPVYHPSYTAPGWTLTAGFTWNWVVPANVTNTTSGVVPANYVELTYAATGNYNITVAETSPVSFGSCVDATPTLMRVTVVAPPSAGFTTVDDTICGNFGVQTITMNITEDVPAALASWAFRIVRVTENINSAGQRIGAALDSTTVHDFTLAAKGRRATTAGFAGAQPNYSFAFTAADLTVQNSLRTRYTYRLYSPASIVGPPAMTVAGTGIVSAISQKSDYLAQPTVNAYAFSDSQVVFTANPAPATGPIYHVPNNFSY